MAPGAVMVAGVVTRRQNGHIAVAGPLVNLGLFVIGLPLGALLLGLTNAFELSSGLMFVDGGLDWRTMLIDICVFWLQANLILGLFNMLPFGPLDGLKVRDWNESESSASCKQINGPENRGVSVSRLLAHPQPHVIAIA